MKLLTAALLCASNLATAKPLPDGMKVALVKNKVIVSKGGVSVPIEDGKLPTEKLDSAELSADGKSIVVKRSRCGGMFDDGSEDGETFPLAAIEAKLENALGMQLHVKKKYVDAIAHFSVAAQKDPATAVYATNLLSAQSMGKLFDDADKTIATYGKAQLPWFAWRLAVDPELKALKGRPSTKLGPAKAGTAKGSLSGKLAFSPLGLVATEVTSNIYDGEPDPNAKDQTAFIVADAVTGKELLRLPSSRKVSDPILATLGFDVVDKLGSLHDDKPITSKDGRKLVKEPKLQVVTAGKTIDIDAGDGWDVGFIPKALVVIAREKTSEDCSGEGPRNFHIEVTATP